MELKLSALKWLHLYLSPGLQRGFSVFQVPILKVLLYELQALET